MGYLFQTGAFLINLQRWSMILAGYSQGELSKITKRKKTTFVSDNTLILFFLGRDRRSRDPFLRSCQRWLIVLEEQIHHLVHSPRYQYHSFDPVVCLSFQIPGASYIHFTRPADQPLCCREVYWHLSKDESLSFQFGRRVSRGINKRLDSNHTGDNQRGSHLLHLHLLNAHILKHNFGIHVPQRLCLNCVGWLCLRRSSLDNAHLLLVDAPRGLKLSIEGI
jgi:hypothetical protein